MPIRVYQYFFLSAHWSYTFYVSHNRKDIPELQAYCSKVCEESSQHHESRATHHRHGSHSFFFAPSPPGVPIFFVTLKPLTHKVCLRVCLKIYVKTEAAALRWLQPCRWGSIAGYVTEPKGWRRLKMRDRTFIFSLTQKCGLDSKPMSGCFLWNRIGGSVT